MHLQPSYCKNPIFVLPIHQLTVEDLILWENIKSGDTKSLNKLHVLYFHQMCLYAHKTIHDHQLIENIVSDCFIILWERRKRIEIKTSVKSYLYRILRNQIIDHYRRKHDNVEILDNLPDIPGESEFDELQRYTKLYSVISKLPDQRRLILEMAVFDSLSYQQIADKLHISKNTVKTQIARAYRFLKESLEPRDFYLFCLL